MVVVNIPKGEKVKERQTRTNQSTYDTLLEEFLPVIHNAAYSIQNKQQSKDAPKDILLSGLRGLKEVLLQLGDANNHCQPRKVLLQRIHCSIMDQIRTK